MMPDYKSEEDLRKEIVSFLEERAGKGNILDLDEDKIKEEFSDNYYDRDDIGDLIDDLRDKEVIERRRISSSILIPNKYEDDLKKTLEDYLAVSPIKKFSLGLILVMILMEWQYFYSFIIEQSFSPTVENFRGVLIKGTIAAYMAGSGVVYSYSTAKEKIDIFKDYSGVITPAFGLPTATLAIMLSIKSFYPEGITSMVIATVVGSALVAGAALGVHLDNE